MGAMCRATDRPEWGADAIFTLVRGKMTLASYFKLPAAQSDAENCVAHNGSLVPVPGRDILVQAWYQGGISVVDLSDARKPMELAFFDRGPMTEKLSLGGHWSAYWYNGLIVASEIGRGLDVLQLLPTELLSQNEIDAAKLVRVDLLNAQLQQKVSWPAELVVAKAYLDQLGRNKNVPADWKARAADELTQADQLSGTARVTALNTLAKQLNADAATSADAARVRALATTVKGMASARR